MLDAGQFKPRGSPCFAKAYRHCFCCRAWRCCCADCAVISAATAAQSLVTRIKEVLADSSMQARAAAVAAEVASYPGVAQAADIALNTVSPWEKLKAAGTS